MTLKIKAITKYTSDHYALLLDADPTLESIASYLSRCDSFELTDGHRPIGIIAVLATEPQTLEIMNIAIHPKFQGQHLGSRLLQFIIEKYSSNPGFNKITIMTGSTSFKQLYLYQKLGFRCQRILANHFSDSALYPDALFENGLQLKDAIMLERPL